MAKADVIIDEEKIRKLAEPGSIADFDGRIIDVKGQHCCRDFRSACPSVPVRTEPCGRDNKPAVETCFDAYAFTRGVSAAKGYHDPRCGKSI